VPDGKAKIGNGGLSEKEMYILSGQEEDPTISIEDNKNQRCGGTGHGKTK